MLLTHLTPTGSARAHGSGSQPVREQLGSGSQPAVALSWSPLPERRMPLERIEHYLVLTDDMEATRDFYVEALGMRVGPRPPLGFPGYWVYVGDTPCIHIGEWRTYKEHSDRQGVPVSTRAAGTGPVDHIAFHAHDYDEIVARLER